MEKNFDASKKQLAIVERKRAAGVDMKLGKVQIKQRKVVGGGGGSAKESKKSQLASILTSEFLIFFNCYILFRLVHLTADYRAGQKQIRSTRNRQLWSRAGHGIKFDEWTSTVKILLGKLN